MRWLIIGVTLFIVVGPRACGRTDAEIELILNNMDGDGACRSITAILISPDDEVIIGNGMLTLNDRVRQYVIRDAFNGMDYRLDGIEMGGALVAKCGSQGQYGKVISDILYSKMFF